MNRSGTLRNSRDERVTNASYPSHLCDYGGGHVWRNGSLVAAPVFIRYSGSKCEQCQSRPCHDRPVLGQWQKKRKGHRSPHDQIGREWKQLSHLV